MVVVLRGSFRKLSRRALSRIETTERGFVESQSFSLS